MSSPTAPNMSKYKTEKKINDEGILRLLEQPTAKSTGTKSKSKKKKKKPVKKAAETEEEEEESSEDE